MFKPSHEASKESSSANLHFNCITEIEYLKQKCNVLEQQYITLSQQQSLLVSKFGDMLQWNQKIQKELDFDNTTITRLIELMKLGDQNPQLLIKLDLLLEDLCDSFKGGNVTHPCAVKYHGQFRAGEASGRKEVDNTRKNTADPKIDILRSNSVDTFGLTQSSYLNNNKGYSNTSFETDYAPCYLSRRLPSSQYNPNPVATSKPLQSDVLDHCSNQLSSATTDNNHFDESSQSILNVKSWPPKSLVNFPTETTSDEISESHKDRLIPTTHSTDELIDNMVVIRPLFSSSSDISFHETSTSVSNIESLFHHSHSEISSKSTSGWLTASSPLSTYISQSKVENDVPTEETALKPLASAASPSNGSQFKSPSSLTIASTLSPTSTPSSKLYPSNLSQITVNIKATTILRSASDTNMNHDSHQYYPTFLSNREITIPRNQGAESRPNQFEKIQGPLKIVKTPHSNSVISTKSLPLQPAHHTKNFLSSWFKKSHQKNKHQVDDNVLHGSNQAQPSHVGKLDSDTISSQETLHAKLQEIDASRFRLHGNDTIGKKITKTISRMPDRSSSVSPKFMDYPKKAIDGNTKIKVPHRPLSHHADGHPGQKHRTETINPDGSRTIREVTYTSREVDGIIRKVKTVRKIQAPAHSDSSRSISSAKSNIVLKKSSATTARHLTPRQDIGKGTRLFSRLAELSLIGRDHTHATSSASSESIGYPQVLSGTLSSTKEYDFSTFNSKRNESSMLHNVHTASSEILPDLTSHSVQSTASQPSSISKTPPLIHKGDNSANADITSDDRTGTIDNKVAVTLQPLSHDRLSQEAGHVSSQLVDNAPYHVSNQHCSVNYHKRSSSSTVQLSSIMNLCSTSKSLAGNEEEDLELYIHPGWLVNSTDFVFVKKIGTGSASVVYLGLWKQRKVAIKVLRHKSNKRDLEDFKREIEIISAIRSPYIIQLYGASLYPKTCILIEYCANGTLFLFLHDEKNYFDWKLFFRFMLQVVRAVDTLHSWNPQIIHRDIKSLNLLLDVNMLLKICDFGLSRFVGIGQEQTFYKMRGTYAYYDPEVYRGNPFTAKSDVYSLGILLWEMVFRLITGKYCRPYSEYSSIRYDFQIIIQADKGLRPTLPPSTPEEIQKIYLSCVHQGPSNRPTCAQLIDEFETLQAQYQSNMEPWDKVLKCSAKKSHILIESRRKDRTLTRNSIGLRDLKDLIIRDSLPPIIFKHCISSPIVANSLISAPQTNLSRSNPDQKNTLATSTNHEPYDADGDDSTQEYGQPCEQEETSVNFERADSLGHLDHLNTELGTSSFG